MSVDLHWHALTSGPDGAFLAEQIRAFVHDRFQKVPLPRFIRSVHVHSFDFGSVAPRIEVKDVCDPLPDFYDSENESDDDADPVDIPMDKPISRAGNDGNISIPQRPKHQVQTAQGLSEQRARDPSSAQRPSYINTKDLATVPQVKPHSPTLDSPSPFVRSQTPAIPGGTSNLSYFHLPLSAGLSGTTTPLAAVAGPHLPATGWPEHNQQQQQREFNANRLAPSAQSVPSSRDPWAQDQTNEPSVQRREPNPNDLQIITRLQYAGDLHLTLTADILLDYPMPSFVGIPLQLNVTGMAFDGVAILAFIKRKAHFCFLNPEDADALIGQDDVKDEEDDLQHVKSDDSPESITGHKEENAKIRSREEARKPVGGLFEDIRVESEIGQRGGGTKPVLKNIGKVENFVLDQVRRIFENELVYPSYWTFLI